MLVDFLLGQTTSSRNVLTFSMVKCFLFSRNLFIVYDTAFHQFRQKKISDVVQVVCLGSFVNRY